MAGDLVLIKTLMAGFWAECQLTDCPVPRPNRTSLRHDSQMRIGSQPPAIFIEERASVDKSHSLCDMIVHQDLQT